MKRSKFVGCCCVCGYEEKRNKMFTCEGCNDWLCFVCACFHNNKSCVEELTKTKEVHYGKRKISSRQRWRGGGFP